MLKCGVNNVIMLVRDRDVVTRVYYVFNRQRNMRRQHTCQFVLALSTEWTETLNNVPYGVSRRVPLMTDVPFPSTGKDVPNAVSSFETQNDDVDMFCFFLIFFACHFFAYVWLDFVSNVVHVCVDVFF